MLPLLPKTFIDLATAFSRISETINNILRGNWSALFDDGTVSAPSVSFREERGTGWYRAGAGQLSAAVLGTELIRATEDGVNDNVLLAGAVRFPSGLSPAQITSNTDDYAPSGVGKIAFLRINSDAARNLSGISAANLLGRVFILVNTGAFTITLKHDVTSAASNRFLCPNNTDVALRQNGWVWLFYDSSSSRWRVMGI